MAKIIPFKSFLYNIEKVSLQDVIAPPYDIISNELREALYKKSPYNIVRIDFGKESSEDTIENNKYTRARGLINEWLKKRILIQDKETGFYGYEINYELFGNYKTTKGFFTLVKLEDLGNGIYPHEETHSKPKIDRLNLLKYCQTNTSPIYSIYNDPKNIIDEILNQYSTNACITANDQDNFTHKLFKINEQQDIQRISKIISSKSLIIADGHHRYEVALEFKKQMDSLNPKKQNVPWDYVLMFLANSNQKDITILPTHRMINWKVKKDLIFRSLGKDFEIESKEMDINISEAISHNKEKSFGLYMGKEQNWYLLKYKGSGIPNLPATLQNLDVVILHKKILKEEFDISNIAFAMDIEQIINQIKRDEFSGAVFLNPTKIEEIEQVAFDNLRMPPKSTYFYPKILTGMVLNKFSI